MLTAKFMNQKGFINIILIIIFVLLVGAGIYFVSIRQGMLPAPSQTPRTTPMPSPTSTSTPLAVIINCGNVATHGADMPSYTADAQKIEDCFWSNFKTGATAALTLHYMGVDTGSNLYFFTECTSGECKIIGYEQNYSANFGGSKSAKDYFICAGLTRDSGGLHALECKFKDSTRNILIPSYSKNF